MNLNESMNRRFFLQFASLLFPVTKLFGWKQEAPKPAALSTVGEAAINVSQILTAIERETQSWVGMTEYRLFLKYDLPIEHIGEWGSIRSIQPLRDAVAKKFGLPPDYILLFGVRFISSDSNPLRRKSADAWSRQTQGPLFYRKLESVYNIEIFKPIQGVKEFPGRKGHWIQAT